jgi:hypothetical protein
MMQGLYSWRTEPVIDEERQQRLLSSSRGVSISSEGGIPSRIVAHNSLGFIPATTDSHYLHREVHRIAG